MSALTETLQALHEADRPEGLVGLSPFSSFLGLEIRREGQILRTRMPFSEALIGNYGIRALHGGTLGALLESAAIFEILYRVQPAEVPKTISLTLDYLRSGRPLDTYAEAKILKLGRRVVRVHAEAWQEARDKPVAAANLCFLVRGGERVDENAEP